MISQACRPQGGQGGHGTPRFLADQLTLSKPEGAEYVHQITTGTPRFSDLSTAPLQMEYWLCQLVYYGSLESRKKKIIKIL